MNKDLGKVTDILLEIGCLLMGSGANTGRIRVTLNRIAHSLGYQLELLITSRALMLSVIDDNGDFYTSKVKRTPPHGVNFKMLSGISRMSWRVQEEDWNINQIIKDVERLKALPHYPRWLVLLLVSLSGAAFCRLFGGGLVEMSITFAATCAGLFVRQETMKKNFNHYLCIVMASLSASLISGLAVKLSLGVHPELAFATSVLFLIPGVPLINSFTDLIDSNLLNGMVRLTNALIIAFSIALGMMAVMILFKI